MSSAITPAQPRQEWAPNEHGNLYFHRLEIVATSVASTFQLLNGMILSSEDENAGMHMNCVIFEKGNDVIMLAGQGSGDVTSPRGHHFVQNDDRSLSPVDAMHLVLGVTMVSQQCGNELPENERYTGVTLVDINSADRVVMSVTGLHARNIKFSLCSHTQKQGQMKQGKDPKSRLRCLSDDDRSFFVGSIFMSLGMAATTHAYICQATKIALPT